MPELPELQALAGFLTDRLRGRTLERVELATLSALKSVSPSLDDLRGGVVVAVGRRGKYLMFDISGTWLVLHLARGGWVQWRERLGTARARPGRGPLALRVGVDGGGGFDVTEQGTEKRLALWVVPEPGAVEGVARLGPDPLDPGFSPAALGAVLDGEPRRLKTVLTDQAVLAGVGNAYSDEVLHAARLSPFRAAGALDEAERERLHAALVGVLADALTRASGMVAGQLKAEKRAGLAVHGRTGQACPVCGDTVREVAYATRSLQYCPTCQTGGKPLADRRLSRLLR